MERGFEESRVATPLNKDGMGKLKRLCAAGELCSPATVPELVTAGSGGLPPAVLLPPPPPLLFPLAATAMEGGRRAEPRVPLPQ